MHSEISSQPTIVFLHIGKTAGSTLGNIIDYNYPNNRLYVLMRNVDNEAFAALPESRRARVDMLRGMTYYGIHRHLPRGARYFTLLRDPVDRVISHYFHNERRRLKSNPNAKPQSLEKWIARAPGQVELQLRMLAGGESMDDALSRTMTYDDVELAKANIERHFDIVGTIDRFDEALLMMQRAYAWRHVRYARRNVAPPNQRENLHADQIAMLTELTARGTALYRWAHARFEGEIASQPPEFSQRLAASKRMNGLYHLAHRATRPLRVTGAWRAVRSKFWPAWSESDSDADDVP